MIGNSIFHKTKAKRRLLGLAIGAFGLTAAMACTGLESLDAAAAEAIIQNVDSLSGEVTVQFKDGTTTTFNLADIDIEALGLLIGNASLQVGDEIEVELDDSKRVRAVTPHVANVEVMIVEVDTDANTMQVEAFNGVQLVLTLTVDTRIELDDHERGTTADLAPGMMLKVKYDTDTNEALKIKHQADDEDDDEHEIKGVITAINSVDHTITVEGVNGVNETYTVLSDTEIEIDDRAPFSELEVGMLVKLELDSGSGALREIEVKLDDDDDHDGRGEHGRGHEGELKGVIIAINADDLTLTVVDEKDRSRTYRANPETEIKIDDHAQFSDLEVGMLVKLEFNSSSLVVHEIEVKVDDDEHDGEHGDGSDDDGDNPVGELHGVISAVHPDARTVTVANDNGINVTYTANADTEIVIGQPASFENLEVGMLVRIWFDRETKDLILMHVRVDD